MARMTGAKFMADTLKAYGVTHVFLVPAILRRALAEMDLIGIKRVITHGEKAAAYMADGYARASGKPGICMAQSVGAANLAAGLQDAYLGLSPVIALTGHKRSDEQYRNAYQEIEHSKPFASVTKFSAVVDNAEQLPHLLRQAFREATTGAPAPVHLDIQGMTGDFATEAEADLEVLFEATFAQRPAFRPEADPESVREAARALTSAQRPVIVAGGGVTSSGAQQEVVELAEMLNIPVATSLNAKGTIPRQPPPGCGCGWFLLTLVRQPRGQRGGPGLLHREPHRQPGHQRVASSLSRYPGDTGRHRPGGTGAHLPRAGGDARRRQGDAATHDRGAGTHGRPC